MLDIQGLTKYFGSTKLYDSLNIHIDQGDRLIITGKSGSGKTTLLRIIMGFVPPSEGKITFLGKDITRLGPKSKAFLRRNIGMVFQDFRLIPHWKVRQNIALPLIVRGESKEFITEMVDSVLQDLGLTHLENRISSTLSGGEQQLVALARVAVMEPVLILADEPFGNLDKKSADRAIEILKLLNNRGAALVIATHNAELAGIFNANTLMLGEQ